ncbi:paraquat-inducible protein A [Bdellovibrio sp. 22V]|uniref:paraquat-inducible protein A n=1 Tax=Bdellovibrio TaxID=958 RepID=UPI002542FAC8|nr:paraquat-inducible protein A [Bdellovibrio sp. 22V]WII72604.1 paraquat-inducible protein A [Bdellovibrio sp. 22V]
MEQSNGFVVCHVCSRHIPIENGKDNSVVCDRCGARNRIKPKTTQLTLAYSLTALILYLPANVFPFMTIELYGNRNTSTIWTGIVALMDTGYWPIAVIVFLASLVIPFLKLAILFYLSFTAKNSRNKKLKTRLYQIVEAIGRWSMLDIFLLAVLVAIMKLGPWTTVRPEIGSVMFALVVIFTMLASAYFDPQIIWEDENGKET